MSMLERYIDQVRLLIDVLPHIAKEDVFALKGGTAINLFYRDMPRLSVDVDLTYLPVEEFSATQKHIHETFERITKGITERSSRYRTRHFTGLGNTNRITVSDGKTRIKIETSPVIRGTVIPPVSMVASSTVTDRFGFTEIQVLSFEDVYGSKLHATLDHQHPRDLFDVKILYDNEGITENLFSVFMVYVASSSRPMHELFAPASQARYELFNEEFTGMTRDSVSKDILEETRTRLHADISQRLTGDIAAFLLSLHDVEPDFSLIGFPEAAVLPAVRWKLLNLEKLKRNNPEKHAVQRGALEDLFR